MKAYFKRLKYHPGISFAALFTVLGGFGGALNKSFQNPVNGFLFGAAVLGFVTWGMVLATNFKSK